MTSGCFTQAVFGFPIGPVSHTRGLAADKAVADTRHIGEPPWVFGVVVELAPQTHDVLLHLAGGAQARVGELFLDLSP